MDVNLNLHPFIKKGWLKKQRARVKVWQKRWVVLNGECLFYFNREGDLKFLGSILLPGNRVVSHSFCPDNPDKYLFEILPEKTKNGAPNREREVFCCDTEVDRQEWIRAIRRAMYKSLGGAIFGQPLKETMEYERKQNRKFPYIVQECIEFLENKGLEYEGLYRLPGRLVLIKELQESFDTGCRLKFEDTQADIHTVASLLKLYLRELPDSIIPASHFQLFMGIALNSIENKQESDEHYIPRFVDAVNELEDDNYYILQYLCRHLHKVSEKSHINKMTLPNLAMVFGPNIIRHADDNPELFRVTAELNQKLAYILIKHCDEIFSVSRDIEVPEGNLIDLPLADCEVSPMQPICNPPANVFCVPSEDRNDKDDLALVPHDANSVSALSADQQQNNNKPMTMPQLRRTKDRNCSLKRVTATKHRSESELEKISKNEHELRENSADRHTKRYGLSYLTTVKRAERVQERKSMPLPPMKKDYDEPDSYPLSPASISSLEDDISNLRDDLIQMKIISHMEKEALQAELDKYKKLYEDSIKEIESLKTQVGIERSGQKAAVLKVVDLQDTLNKYQIKYD